MKWQDAWDIKPSKNVRGEDVYDIFRKDTNDMIWADIPAKDIDKFLGALVSQSEYYANQELDALFTVEEKQEAPESKPLEIGYDRLRGLDYPVTFEEVREEDEDKS